MESFNFQAHLMAHDMVRLCENIPLVGGPQTVCLNSRHPHPHHRANKQELTRPTHAGA